jgi:hypothetical protein
LTGILAAACTPSRLAVGPQHETSDVRRRRSRRLGGADGSIHITAFLSEGQTAMISFCGTTVAQPKPIVEHML